MTGLFIIIVGILILEIILAASLIFVKIELDKSLPQKMSEKDFDDFKSILQRGVYESFERGWRVGYRDAMKGKLAQRDNE